MDFLSPPLACGTAHGEGCITCGDEALPLRVLKVDPDRGLALCEDEQGRHETVQIELVAPVEPGDSVLVHAGTGIARLEAEQSRQVAGQDAPAEVTL